VGESVPHCSTHAEILGRGVTAWNAWRKENPSAIPDLSGASLAWHEDWLNGADLREAHLQNSVLRFAALATADLEAADMSGADLMHAQLEQANLRSTNLSNARLDHAHLAGAILSNARLDGARLRFTTLSTADLQAADMSDADLMYARLDQADLSAAIFKNARLDYADLAGAKLSKCQSVWRMFAARQKSHPRTTEGKHGQCLNDSAPASSGVSAMVARDRSDNSALCLWSAAQGNGL
jgi:uncharacterized protein YjbI with pentapeptide repeats